MTEDTNVRSPGVIKKWFAVLLVLGSALIYGITPALLRLTYEMGNNAINATFFRALVAIPLLLLVLWKRKIPIAPDKKNMKIVFLWLCLCASITCVFLTLSYAYIPVGIATVIHYVYPTLVAVFGLVIFHHRLDFGKALSLALCLAGICLFFEKEGNIRFLGIIFALLSGVAYALYIIGLEHPAVQDLHYLRLALYTDVSVLIISGMIGLFRNEIVTDMPALSWIYLVICAVLTMIVAPCMFVIGTKEIGALTSAILSTLEPITAVFFGWLFLGETLTRLKLLGCLLIIASIIVITQAQNKSQTN